MFINVEPHMNHTLSERAGIVIYIQNDTNGTGMVITLHIILRLLVAISLLDI